MRSISMAATTALLATVALAVPAEAATRHHKQARAGVTYDHGARARSAGGSQLVSDGPGTGYGFHRLPGPYRVGSAIARGRQEQAIRSAVADDAVESYGPFYGGLAGDAGFGAGGYGNRGIFSYPDGYGSPYFAGYYGPASGPSLGPLGNLYDDN